jgi:hypothetical protein
MEWDTIKKFNMTKKDAESYTGVGVHKYNHIAQNVLLAPQIREYKNL